ncbi:Transcriptional regulator, AraC family [Candidatus Rhodobacter oscarellae]|uniref:Transcriptional regulator, AraC family n=1 Tax=Candidatus Rhodobacter oscarellae TaxID=1675527 RepID=A0A0J9E8H9_9RHOB|nr:GyrI-like domain-containing protein [Candidatus Rhodobacter lobularis]KMW59052.1 Transcriptional regulator, AraC family [Candidatus Rhodobacter lobularis]
MKPDRIADAQERRIIGANGSYTHENRSGIPAQWAEWDYGAVTGVVGGVYGVSHSFGGPTSFQYLCGLEVSADAPVPDGQTDVTLPAGKHAVFVINGHVSKIAEVFEAVFSHGALGEEWGIANGPQFEHYTEEFDPASATGKVEIWFPVARKA